MLRTIAGNRASSFTYLFTFVFMLPALMLSVGLQSADAEEVYSWKDADGRLVFGNNPPADSEAKKKVEAELSRYSTEQVFERYGISGRAALTNQTEDTDLTESLPTENAAPAKLNHSELDIAFDEKNQITICAVEVTNDGSKTGSDISVSFQFPDGSLIAADGPASLAPGKSSVYSVPESQLPLTIEQDEPVQETEEAAAAESPSMLPKVLIEFS